MERPETVPRDVPLPRPYVDAATDLPYSPEAPPQPRFTPHPQPIPRPRFTPRQPAARRPARERAWPARPVIGDELRIPILWCEFGTCVERYTHVDALGEQDLRGRALAAGWHYDLLGRLACPSCAQHDETFWITRPPVPAPRKSWLPAVPAKD
jgi:hypothetical protein